jgi:Peptidase family M28
MDDELDRPEGKGPKRPSYRKLILIFLLVLFVGLGTGVAMNLIFAEPPVKKAEKKAREKAEPKAAGGDVSDDARTAAGTKALQFSSAQAMGHIFALSESIGERSAGSVKESAAADYIVSKLGEYGYVVEDQPFTMPDGFGSRNIMCTRRGARDGYDIVVAAHYDSAEESRGAVDNGSGAGAVLELARVFSGTRPEPTLHFVFLGANRPGAADMDARFLGARTYVDLLGTLKRKEIVGMIAVDSVGQGDILVLRTQGSGLQRLRDKLATFAGEKNIGVTTLKSTDDSDNIPFEDSEVPAVWIEWCNPDGTLSTDNRYTSVSAGKVEAAGSLLEIFLKDLTSDDLEELKY